MMQYSSAINSMQACDLEAERKGPLPPIASLTWRTSPEYAFGACIYELINKSQGAFTNLAETLSVSVSLSSTLAISGKFSVSCLGWQGMGSGLKSRKVLRVMKFSLAKQTGNSAGPVPL